MGSGSSQSESRQEARKKYMRVIDKRKQRYARQNSLFLGNSTGTDWKDCVTQALDQAEKEIGWGYWPQDVRKFLWAWNAASDTKWRSNVLWFDYLKSYASEPTQPRPVTFSTLKIPLAPLFSSDMQAKSLQDFLRGHFAQTSAHAIAAMIKTFADSFAHFYIDPVSRMGSGEQSLAVDIVGAADVKRVDNEVKTFIAVAMVGFQSYYGGLDFLQLMKEKAVNAKDLITDQVMHTKVHDILLQMYSVLSEEKEALYRQKLNELSSLPCRDLGIEPLFCIDQPRPHIADVDGYRYAIETLRELPTTTSPMGKMNIVIQATQRICECIDEYWKDADNVTPEQLVINADQILSIFVYIVLKAKVRNLMSHVRLILEYVRNEVQQGNYGYYLATLEASIEHILLFSTKEVDRGNESFHTCVGD